MAKKKKSGLNFSSPIVYIILGALLVLFPGSALNWAMTIAGLFFIISGIIDLTKSNLFGGIVNLIIGIVILALGWTIVGVVLLVLGIFIAIKGLLSLIAELKKKKKNVFAIIVAIITLIVGLALAFGNALSNIVTIVGVVLIIDGFLDLLAGRK